MHKKPLPDAREHVHAHPSNRRQRPALLRASEKRRQLHSGEGLEWSPWTSSPTDQKFLIPNGKVQVKLQFLKWEGPCFPLSLLLKLVLKKELLAQLHPSSQLTSQSLYIK